MKTILSFRGDFMKRIHFLAIGVLILLLSVPTLFATGTREADTAPVFSAVDASGAEVSVSVPLEKIAVVGKAALIPSDALYMFSAARYAEVTLAKTNQGLGDFFAFLLDEADGGERLGQSISAEEILAIDPDLILTKQRNRNAFAPIIEPFGIPLFSLDLESSQSWSDEIAELGKLLGEEERAEQIISFFAEKEQYIVDTRAGEKSPRTLILQATTGDGITSFSVAPEGWIQQEIISKAGGTPLYPSTGTASGWSIVSMEQISEWNPDVIIIVSYRSHGGKYLEQIRSSTLWEPLTAVKNGNVYLAPSDFVNYFQSDSRWILALQWLAKTLHPEAFASLDIEEEIRNFYRTLYSVDSSDKLERLVQRYRESLK